MLAPESALEGCEPAESSSSPSLWTAAQLQPQEAGIIQGLQMQWLSGAESTEASGHGRWVVETSSRPS